MKTELERLVWTEFYRPSTLEEIILKDDEVIYNLLNLTIFPSLILHSKTPGTGKTSLAKIIISELKCDSLELNASEERGIDTIRDKIKSFVTSLSSTNSQRCVFMDEGDSVTKIAQDSLRNLMEEYSGNCFFIFAINDINKIIKPLQSRCIILDFNNPPKEDIEKKLSYIIDKEKISLNMDIREFINKYYPDIRTMVKKLQEIKLGLKSNIENYKHILLSIKSEDFSFLKKLVYNRELDILDFNNWLFEYIFVNWEEYGLDRASKIANILADTEKSSNIGVSLEIIFLANILEVSKLI